MSIKGNVKEAAGFIKEEAYEQAFGSNVVYLTRSSDRRPSHTSAVALD